MKRNSFYPASHLAQIPWLTTFANEMQLLGPGLGYTAEQIAAIVADCRWLIYLLQAWLPATRHWSQTGTNTMADAETGDGTTLMVLPVYVAPDLPEGAAPVKTGALTRIFGVAQDIKNGGKCSETDQAKLGILGTAAVGPDYTTLQPVFTLSIVGGQVVVHAGFGGYAAYLDAIELQVDRNDGKGNVLLAMPTTTSYTDPQALPVAHTVWTYRAIFLLNNARVGVWSQSVSIAVQA
jgi:hypothetical protein